MSTFSTTSVLAVVLFFAMCQASRIARSVPSDNLESVPMYKAVNYLEKKLQLDDPKVRDLHIRKLIMYNHIFYAYKSANKDLSMISKIDSIITGVNLVIEKEQLSSMYAPGKLENVVDFVHTCYNSVTSNDSQVFVRILQATENSSVNQGLIRDLTTKFQLDYPNKQLVLWEQKSQSDSFLTNLGYRRIACGGSGGLCDFQKVGMPKRAALDSCLYGFGVPM